MFSGRPPGVPTPQKEAETLKQYELFINGKFIPNGDRKLIDVINPATEEVISQVPQATDEDDLIPLLEGTEIVIADPLYRPIVPESARFVPLPHEGFSGRIWRRDIPDLAEDLTGFMKENDLI